MAYRPVHVVRNASIFSKKDVFLIALDLDILYWLADGLNPKQASSKIGRSYRTTRGYIYKLHNKTGYCEEGGLVRFALQYKVLFFRKGVLMKTKGNIKPKKKK
ncbi:MAG TPA: hypothetical protein VI757_01810 [Bacteroidia bacterium]|nr:hypothetical protein [Bacteroidia bacterium]